MQLFEKYKYAIIGGVVIFFLALLLMTLGFFKTLFLIILGVVGSYCGNYLQRTGLLEHFWKNIK